MMLALPLATFETALIKLFGSFVMVFAAALLLQRWAWPALVSAHLRRSSKQNFVRETEL
jgi:hypothetical protein